MSGRPCPGAPLEVDRGSVKVIEALRYFDRGGQKRLWDVGPTLSRGAAGS